MVNAQFRHGKTLPAVLALVAVAGEQVASIQRHPELRRSCTAHQANDARRSNAVCRRTNPVVIATLILPLQLGDFQPGLDIKDFISTLIHRDHLGDRAKEQDESSSDRDHTSGHPGAIQDKDRFVKTAGVCDHQAVPRVNPAPLVSLSV